jgi:hypothetical protein
MTLRENGDIDVVETQTLNFAGAPFTFGYRTIRTGIPGANDDITNISVNEGPVDYELSTSQWPNTYRLTRADDEVTINWYFEPALGERTYTLRYTIEGGVQVGTSEQGDGDQIFWSVIPDDHPNGIINQYSAQIQLPEGVYPQQYTGTTDYLVEAYNNEVIDPSVDIEVSKDGRTITYSSDRPLLPGESFDVRVQFPHGLLAIPVPAWQQTMQRGDAISLGVLAISLLILVGGPLLVLLLWYLRGRDPELAVVVPEYVSEPPDDLPPAVVGTLVDEKVDMEDIVSTLLDLAHRGYVAMTEKKNDFLFVRTDKAAKDLRGYERRFLQDVFEGEEERTLNSMRYEFAGNLPGLRSDI